MLSRMLVSAPDSAAGSRFWREWSDNGALAAYDRKLFELIGLPLPIEQAGGGVHGYLESVTGGAEIDGKHRREVWSLVSEE